MLFRKAEELTSLGLDIPLTAKAAARLSELGYSVDTDFTCEDFSQKVISMFGGESNA